MAMAGGQDTGKGKSCKIMKSVREVPVNVCRALWKLGRDDPRRVIHAMKVGLALTLVSFLYVLEPLFEGIGQNAMWAVMTVVVVLEFTAGATLCKGFNRGLGTLCAGSLAFFIEFVAGKSRKDFRAVFVGASVFVIGFLSTYIRFFPQIKKNYDYGVVVFLLTFNLITVSSYRVQNVFHLAQQRLYTIAIGCGICLAMSFLILPYWSGEDLRRSTVYKLEGLARSIEACVNEYFKDKEITVINEEAEASKESIQKGYRAVLDSKSSDESLAHFASWEPRFSRQCHKCPWHRYVKIGAVMRHFAYTAAALHGCLESQIQTPKSVRSLFRDPCTRVAREVSTVLHELSTSIEKGRRVSPDSLTDRLQEALQALNSAIKSQPRLFLGSSSANRMLVEWKRDKENSPRVALSSARTDISALLEFRNKRAPDPSKDPGQRRQLSPSLSKLAMTSLEFSEALPFAAFASLLVEMVARLGLVIHEVEELGRAAHFKELSQKDDVVIGIGDNVRKPRENGREIQHHHASQVGE